jgi:hypothetical protein
MVLYRTGASQLDDLKFALAVSSKGQAGADVCFR